MFLNPRLVANGTQIQKLEVGIVIPNQQDFSIFCSASLVIRSTFFVGTGDRIDPWKSRIVFRKLIHKVPKRLLSTLVRSPGHTDTRCSDLLVFVATLAAVIGEGVSLHSVNTHIIHVVANRTKMHLCLWKVSLCSFKLLFYKISYTFVGRAHLHIPSPRATF
jgi:hypothetical protein